MDSAVFQCSDGSFSVNFRSIWLKFGMGVVGSVSDRFNIVSVVANVLVGMISLP